MDDTPLGGRYRRERLLGRGAMGEVWLAEDLLLHRLVAVKSFPQSIQAPDPVDLNRMIREARLAARLNHPNAVAVYDLVVEDGRPNVVMEYVAGKTLAEEIAAAGGGIAPERIVTAGIAVADALAEAHELGIVHRDVKPANVLITARGVPKLADFGIARINGEAGGTITGLMIGTPAYVAPEIAQGREADARSDIWSLGITLYAALEGHSPFSRGDGDSPLAILSRVLTEPVAPPRHGGPLGDVVMRLLAAEPAARPSAAEVVELLRNPPRRPERDERPTRAIGPAFDPGPRAPTGPPPPPRPPVAHPHPPVVSPTLVGVSSGDRLPLSDLTGYGSPTHAPGRHRRTAALIVTLGGLFVVAAVVAGAIVLANRHGGGAGSSSGASSPIAQGSSTDFPSTPTTTSSTSQSTSHTVAPPPQTYTAPGGISVRGPEGWTGDDSAGVKTIRDYDAPGGDRSDGTYFRIGVGNPHPLATFQAEVQGALDFLHGKQNAYDHVQTDEPVYLTYLGTDAADIEYLGTNADGVRRHVIERLWIDNGQTYEIQLNAPTDEWTAMRPVFTQLVSSATLS